MTPFQIWLRDFTGYFNRAADDELLLHGRIIEANIVQAANVFVARNGFDPFSARGNFGQYWSLVRFGLINSGMPKKDYKQLEGLVESFNSGTNWE
ncbi:hypothetical protein [Pseudobacteroides cellulosolvens]|uniref:Uncharacterized protein n=1 Tax=Pseudobacteroides cellulosolvens ATCC 35603 = DSM 2933 TaxID=398512 RepID=A0A0L6JHY7_9FIRM|nr:hypothetical protein [Pseudobacteroides cellulosolvens]KNY25339.1 hypothetical protein Bccel_0599 [Pseudobacteroides cellulosolvens ATCC 35603 = DSM 2933]